MNATLKKNIFIVPAVFLLAYTGIRAYRLSFTVDEANTFIRFVLDSYSHIFRPVLLDANNHVLNTAFMKFFSSWLPVSELTLRLQSLLAHSAFLIFSWLLLKDFKNVWIRLATYIFININPYLLDFFSLARGYALSWGMMAGSLYYFKSYLESDKKKAFNIGLTFFFAAFSVLASFSMLNYYIALLLVYVTVLVINVLKKRYTKEKIKSPWLELVITSAISLSVLSYSIYYSLLLAQANLFYFGGNTSFWKETVNSLIDSSAYGLAYPIFLNYFIKILLIAVPLACMGLILYQITRKKNETGQELSGLKFTVHENSESAFFVAIFAIFLLIIIGINVQFYAFGTRFVMDRAGIFILILFSIVVALFLKNISNAITGRVLIVGLCLFSIFHFARAFNFSYVHEWKMNADTKQMMLDLQKIQETDDYKQRKDILIEPQSEFVTTTQFYQYIYKLNKLNPIEKDYKINRHADFYYYFDSCMWQFHNQPVEIIKRYPLSHTVLLKNLKKEPEVVLSSKLLNMTDTVSRSPDLKHDFEISTVENIKCINASKDALLPGISFDLNKYNKSKGIKVKAEASVYFAANNKSGDLIIAEYDKSGKILQWLSYPLNQYLMKNKGWMNIPFDANFENISDNANTIKVFLWNKGEYNFYVSDLNVEITAL